MNHAATPIPAAPALPVRGILVRSRWLRNVLSFLMVFGHVRDDGRADQWSHQPGYGSRVCDLRRRLSRGGVILKDGFDIRGLNTAATLWCMAAVGTLAGIERLDLAVVGAVGVLCANLILRPLALLVNRVPAQHEEHEILYSLRCTCRTADETHIRTIMIQNIGSTSLALVALHSLDDELLARVHVKAYLKAIGPKEPALEQIVTRLSFEVGVTAISWEVAASVDAEDATITASEELVNMA